MMRMQRKQPIPTHAQELVALRTGREPRAILRDLYVDQGHSQADIADELRVSRATIARWLLEFGFSREDRGAGQAVA